MSNEEFSRQVAEGYGIAQADHGGMAVVNIGCSPEQLQSALRAAGEAQQATIESLSLQLNTTQEAVRGFLKILDASDVPLDKLAQTLASIAQQHCDLLKRLSALNPDDAPTKAKIAEARAILSKASSTADYNLADGLLAEAESLDMQALREVEDIERVAKEFASRKRRSAAATRAGRGELNLTRRDFLEAAKHFKAAAEIVGNNEHKARAAYLNRSAGALQQYGDEKGDNAVLEQAIAVYQATSQELPRKLFSLDWAMIQNNLAITLRMVGSRESGTTG